MKKLLLFAGLFIVSGNIALAQSSNLRKAKSNYARYEELGGAEAGDLAIKFLKDAVEPIDLAAENDRTKENPETWAIYSLIHANIAFAEKNDEHAEKAKQGIQKATALDEDDKQEANITNANIYLRNYYQTIGYDEWQAENFKGAYDAFEKGLEVAPGDTTLLFYSGYAAIQTQDYDKAIKQHEQIVPFKDFSDHKFVMANLSRLYLELQDTTKALEYADLAAKDYPEDGDLAFQNIELNLIVGNEEKVIQDIEEQISRDSNNATLYYYKGIAHSASENDEQALEAYKAALAIDPEHVDANLNTAAAIMNMSNKSIVALSEDKTLSNEEYAKRLEELKVNMGEAVPYLEKAIEIDPSNTNALRNLKAYYDFIDDQEKSAEIQARIDAN